MKLRSIVFKQIVVPALVLGAALQIGAIQANAAGTVHFKVRVDASAVPPGQTVSGRLLIFMTRGEKPVEAIEPDFTDPEAVYLTAIEASNIDAKSVIDVDADTNAFPRGFADAPAGEYQVMALLDRDHSYTYNGSGPGDITSIVTKAKMPAKETTLTLSRVIPEQKLTVPDNARLISFESPMLSAFWGRPVKMEATVVLPLSYGKVKTQTYPTVYSVSGYGGLHEQALRGAANTAKQMAEGKRPEMIYVYLEAHCSLGHHVFADSANNGPWGTALTKEFIPYLEKQFKMDARPSGRFLTGHSSGGWSTLWIMVTHPDFFGGTWSTSPDPVDFRSFTGPDITKYPPQNAYTDAAGKDYNLVRMGGKELMTVRQYAAQETVSGYYGGQFASFNAVFSPKGPDGQPMKLFDIATGLIDPAVQRAWQKYDISLMLRSNWKTMGPRLKGKLHIIVGTADTFHLDEAVRLLDAELKKLGSDARFEYLEGRTHFDLYQDGLGDRIAKEMYAIARPAGKK